MSVTKLGRLTPHQRRVYDRLERFFLRRLGSRDPWVPLDKVGSRGALEHCVVKGWARRQVTLGPRGGEHLSYRPTPEALARTEVRR